ncbi:hypothetical protein NAT51_07525 [Flavobacterium amniphilum]|uniref:hypothetical protein n=1 Tax=Flavobacterium amniphilum TaxID=1834035 RepID=UPI00202A85E7|nr:hypothetical protein [Flavobacterium amniphilum]MCL9805366.1 hypothetical protein [Flavobacterium amniphilum]
MRVINVVSFFKAISVVMGIALFCCVGFSYDLYNDFSKTEKTLNDEKNSIIKELKKSKDSLEVAISNNSGLKTELIVERQKVANLLEEIGRTNIDAASLIKYKTEVSRLKDLVTSLSRDKAQLKMNYDLLKIQRDSTILVLTNAKKYRETLTDMNENLANKAKKAPKVLVINLKTIPCKQSTNGDVKPTDKASKVNMLQIGFMVVGNKMVKPCDKEYYVQIIDSKNNIVGQRKTKKFGEQILDYSYEHPVKFKNETLEISTELPLDKAEKGIYFVNVFDKNELASKMTFALR